MQPGDEHDGVVAGRQHGPGGFGEVEFGGDRVVVAADGFHHREQGDHGEDGDPGAVGDFGVQHDDEHHGGAMAPTVLMSAGDRASAAGARVGLRGMVRFQCRTMPAWLRVKLVNTPMM